MRALIDIGSTNLKYAFYDGHEFVSEGSVLFPEPSLNDGVRFEVPTKDIVGSIIHILSLRDDINEIYISTQMHGYVLLDKNYNELTPYISWRDRRATLTDIKFDLSCEYGVAFKANLPKASIHYFENNDSFVYSRIAHFMTLGSYIAYTLTGVNETHITDCAPSGFYNIFKKEKDITSFSLPIESYQVKEIGRYKGAKVYTPVGDQQASVYGLPYKDCYILNLGTASQICEVVDEFVCGDFETRPFFNNSYLLTFTGLPGSDAIKGGMDKEELKKIYLDRFSRLPKAKKLLITGGLLKVKKDLFEEIFKGFPLEVIYNDGADSLIGLSRLSSEVEE